MITWDRRLKAELKNLKIIFEVIKRFIDDINGVFGVLPLGTEYKDGVLQVNVAKIEEDKEVDADLRTMKIIKDIANDVDSMIQMTIDVPSRHDDKKLPVLDLKVWLSDDEQIYYMFYEKPMKSRFVMTKMSAMPMKMKITCLTQEAFRRLHNTKQEVDENTKIDIMNNFMISLKVSGYNHSERINILEGGFRTYDKLKEREKKGERPFYRPSYFEKEKRKRSHGSRKKRSSKLLYSSNQARMMN